MSISNTKKDINEAPNEIFENEDDYSEDSLGYLSSDDYHKQDNLLSNADVNAIIYVPEIGTVLAIEEPAFEEDWNAIDYKLDWYFEHNDR